MLFDDLNTACAGAFGEPAVIRRPGRPDVTVTGIFDRRHYQQDTDGGPVSTLVTSLAVVDADVGGPVPAGAAIELRGLTFTVSEPRPDGQGMTVLLLRESR
ncbi:hypothetical protein VY88_03045 [Azospirillum thiophilum]|uniref:Uncharacterized protein n=1 Tax=Azospirillum thiophilum TaxID=528244 RepID=A0AAC8VX72_9PROT|nr:hypothetical protein [Azospirillum thiophilum]ALG71134.1 hypothetical protein AL072_09665 [Azospirillum thiophilum]KJR65210.1 hypothetical protein VY88_03045 [Azospirillum thiophilum]